MQADLTLSTCHPNRVQATSESDKTTLMALGGAGEPGSAGKESAENTIRNLAGYRVFADKVTGSKEVRAEPFAAQVQGGNVWLPAGLWHREYLGELEQFPRGKFRDQVDASTGAFNRLVSRPSYNLAGLAS